MPQERILVVDDEMNIVNSLKEILSDEGYDVSVTKDGLNALDMIQSDPPDLLLLDVWVPGMDGIEVLKTVKTYHPEIEVLVMSGHGTIDTAVKATKLKHDFAKYGKTCGFGLEKIKHDPVDVIINATSASIDGKMPEIASGVANGAICYDLMYGQQTPFMDWAKANNAAMVVDGLGMLVEQAASAFEFWTTQKPDTQSVINSLRR